LTARLQISDCRFQIADFRFQTADSSGIIN
jgi:hypothetical protein